MSPEAPLERDENGVAPAGEGWFVLNARDARWRDRGERGLSLAFTGATDFEAETWFPQLGVNLAVLRPGQPLSLYHREADQEALLVLAGEALLIIEGQERTLGPWDFVHSPPGTEHVLIGGGRGPCTVLAIGAREHMAREDWGAYTVSEAAIRRGAGVRHETTDSALAYARFSGTRMTPFRRGWLPGEPASS